MVDQTINEIEFLFPLSEELEDRLRVSALKRKGDIIKFVVQYEACIENNWRHIKGDGEMKKELAVKRNLDLLNEFMKYAFDNPEVMDKIPPEAELVILPVNDRRLSDYNKKMADKMYSQGKSVVLVKMKRPEPTVPELELMMTGTG